MEKQQLNEKEKEECWALLTRWRSSRALLIAIVFIAFLLDMMLLNAVVPILPSYLLQIEHPKEINQSSMLIVATKDHHLEHESGRIGILLSSKAFVQLIGSPFASYIISKFGYGGPMFLGFVLMFTSTLGFAFANTYTLLMISRAIQGLGASFTNVAGPSMLSARYDDDQERGQAMSRAMSGMSIGLMIGPVYGGFLYHYLGKPAPFLILAIIALGDGLLRLIMITPEVPDRPSSKTISFWTIARHPHILIVVGAPMFGVMGVAMLQAILPIHMMSLLHGTVLHQSLIFMPGTVALFISQNIFGSLAFKIGRELTIILGLILISVALFTIPLCKVIIILIAPQALIGCGMGMIYAATVGILTRISAEWKYQHVSGYVFALFESAIALAFIVGPSAGGFLAQEIGFTWALDIVASINLLYAVLFGLVVYFMLPKPVAPSDETEALIERSNIDTAD